MKGNLLAFNEVGKIVVFFPLFNAFNVIRGEAFIFPTRQVIEGIGGNVMDKGII